MGGHYAGAGLTETDGTPAAMAPGHREGCKGLPEPQALRRPGLGREKRRAGVFSVIAAVHMETGTFMTF